MTRALWIAALLASAPACVTTQILADESAGQIGCPPDEIAISDKRDGAFNLVWKAQCRGKTYFCTFGDPTACTEEASAAATPAETAPPTAATPVTTDGCAYDTQCKGERICHEGRCTDPPAAAVTPDPAPAAAPEPAPAPARLPPRAAEFGPTPPPRS